MTDTVQKVISKPYTKCDYCGIWGGHKMGCFKYSVDYWRSIQRAMDSVCKDYLDGSGKENQFKGLKYFK